MRLRSPENVVLSYTHCMSASLLYWGATAAGFEVVLAEEVP